MSRNGKEHLIRFSPEKCLQCYGCETACKTWRGLPHGVRYRRVLTIWKGSFPEVESAPLSLACLHCLEPACAAACPEEAISKDPDTGLVLVDGDLCTGCQACADACPFGVPQFGEDGVMEKCDLCIGETPSGAVPPCVDTCPGEALQLAVVTPAGKQAEETAVADVLAGS